MPSTLVLLRHGQTEWTLSGRHTGVSDIPLTARGEEEARAAGERLKTFLKNSRGDAFDCGNAPAPSFSHVFTSPRMRARRTFDLTGFRDKPTISDDLREWTYGDYEGLVQSEIQERHPGWDIFQHGCPNGESVAEVAARADRFIAQVRRLDGPVLAVSHGHFTRALALRWVGLALVHGNRFDSDTASLAVLSYNKDSGQPLINVWNLS